MLNDNNNNSNKDNNRKSFFDCLHSEGEKEDFFSSLFKELSNNTESFANNIDSGNENKKNSKGFGIKLSNIMNAEAAALSTMAICCGVFELYIKNKTNNNKTVEVSELEKIIFSSILKSLGLNSDGDLNIHVLSI